MDFQKFKKEARRLSTIFALSAGFAAGGVIGGGVLYHEYHDPVAKVEYTDTDTDIGTNTIRIPADNKTIIEAEVMQVSADGSVVVRAHPWLGQFMFASVTPNGTAGAANAPLTADLTNQDGTPVETLQRGQKVWLRGLQGVGLSGMAAEIPDIRASGDKLEGPIQARAVRVIDGDTPEVVAQIWPGFYAIINIRIDGIDTPEKGGRAKNPYEAELGAQATEAARALIEGKDVLIYNLANDKFGGRMLADVKTLDGTDVAGHLISQGLARAYDGGKREPWDPPEGYVPPAPKKPRIGH